MSTGGGPPPGSRASRSLARLPSPTTRGAVVAAAGACLVVVGVATALPALVRAGVLALALPLVAAAVLLAARPSAQVVRGVEPSAVPVGQDARVRLGVEVSCALPLVSLMAQDARSPGLGARSRFVIAGAARTRAGRPGAPATVTYRVRPTRRGHHRVGPLTITLTDPMALARAAPLPVTEVAPGGVVPGTASASASASGATLLATPVVVPLHEGGGEVAGQGAGDRSTLAAGAGGEPAAGVRQYRTGDDVRRVHWRATARTDHLMVREDEHSAAHRAVVVLAVEGPWHGEGFERAVSVAASVVAALGAHGAPVELHAGSVVTGSVDDLVRALALVGPGAPGTPPPGAGGRLRHGSGGVPGEGSRVVAVLSGMAAPASAAALAPLVRPGMLTGALVVDPPSTDRPGRGGRGGTGGPAGALLAGGWQVATIGRDDDLATALPPAWAVLAESAGARRGAA